MRVYKHNAQTDELISVEKLTDEVINRMHFSVTTPPPTSKLADQPSESHYATG